MNRKNVVGSNSKKKKKKSSNWADMKKSKPSNWVEDAKKQNEKKKKQKVDKQLLKQTACPGAEGRFEFYVDPGSIEVVGNMLWFHLANKCGVYTYTPGMMAAYVWHCFIWYLFKNGRVEDGTVPLGCGVFVLPRGVAKLFQLSSEYENKGRSYYCSVKTDSATDYPTYPHWKNGYALDLTLSDASTVADVTNVNFPLSTFDMRTISEHLEQTFKDSVICNDISWGTVTGELFVSNNTALHKIYPWSNIGFAVNTADTWPNFVVTAASALTKMTLVDFILRFETPFGSVVSLLKSMGFNPMYFRAENTYLNYQYVGQIFAEMCSQTEMTDPRYYEWIEFCWSYLTAFLSTPGLNFRPAFMGNYELKKFKVPFVLQFMVKQLMFKTGNTVYVATPEVNFNWSYPQATVDTTTMTEWGCPGYLSASVSGQVQNNGDNNISYNSAFTAVSWRAAVTCYKNIVSAYPNIMKLASVAESKGAPCGCFAKVASTSLSDNETNTNLGTMSPQTIYEMICPGGLSKGMCEASGALTILNATGHSGAAVVRFSSALSNKLDAVLSVAGDISENALVYQAGQFATPNVMIMRQLEGPVEYKKYEKSQVAELIKDMIVTAPILRDVGTITKGYVEGLLGSKITTSGIYDVLNQIGWQAKEILVDALVGKMVGVAYGKSEL